MLRRGEIDPPEIEDSIEFQIIDWFIPEASYPSTSYTSEYDIEVYGVTSKGYTVRCIIEGFEPFFYVKCPEDKTKEQIKRFMIDLSYQLENGCARYCITSKEGKKTWREAISKTLCSHYKGMTLVQRYDFWGFQDGKKSYFIKISVTSLKLFRVLRDVFSGIKGYSLYESNIEPFIRFIHNHDIAPCGWVSIKKDDISDEVTEGNAHYKFRVLYSDVKPIDINTIAPLLIASFDIECTSSHGDFPLAIKDYSRLAQQLILNSSRMDLKNDIENCLNSIVKGKDYIIDDSSKIQGLFFKNHKHNLEEAVKILSDIIRKIPNITEEDLRLLFEQHLPKLEGDSIIQIGTTYNIFGSDAIVYKNIITLKDCDNIEGCDVICCKNESQLLTEWKKLLRDTDPDILTGYNILGFDFKYIYDRTMELGLDESFRLNLGRSGNRLVPFQNKTLTSSALGEVITTFYDIEGMLIVDVFTYIKREMNLESYKLDFVAAQILKEHKNDLKPSEIFSRYVGGTANDIKIIAEYCIQDCCLVNKIMHKKKIIENNFGMANVCLVPASYIFHRGQGIKIYSLVLNECSKRKQVIPTLHKDILDEDNEGYIGAIVLEPKTGIYIDDPIIVFDYSSLYPSSMIAENLSHDSFIIDHDKYIRPDGTLNSNNKNLSLNKIRLPDGNYHYFVKDATRKYTIPQILQKLIKQRKITRSKIEYKRVITKTDESFIGLIKEKETTIIVNNLEYETSNEIHKNNIKSIEDAYNDFEKSVFDSLQLAYKITANSLYGQTGAKTSQIYMKPIAQSTTSTGRNMIMMAKNFVETHYNADVIYGDSVMPYTPITINNNNNILITTFEAFEGYWTSYEQFKPFDSDRFNKEQLIPNNIKVWTHNGWAKIRRIIRHKTTKKIYRVFTHTGIVDVTEDHSLLDNNCKIIKPSECIIGQELLHSKPRFNINHIDIDSKQAYIYGLFIGNGSCHNKNNSKYSWVLNNKNLDILTQCKEFLENIEQIPFKIIDTRDSCSVYKLLPLNNNRELYNKYRDNCYLNDNQIVPNIVLNSSSNVIEAFHKGLSDSHYNNQMHLKQKIYTSSQVSAQSFCVMLQLLDYNVSVDFKKNLYRLKYSKTNLYDNLTYVNRLNILHEAYDGYVYDIETEYGVFHGGIGNIILKNTDSIFCKFSLVDDNGQIVKGKEAIPHAINLGLKIEKHIADDLLAAYKPQALNYEKVLSPLILFSKKRYTGLLYETDPNKCYQKSMGIVLKRRDNAHIVKDVYGSIIDKILYDNDLEGSFKELDYRLERIVRGDVDINSLILSKTLKSTYAAPEKIPHKALADRIAIREPGNKPAINDRIPFIYIKNDDPYALQGERVEHPDYIKDHPEISPDYLFYITNQIMNPVVQLYALCMESIPGYNCDENYWINLEEDLKASRDIYLDDVKRANRLQDLRERMVIKLLFSKYIDSLGGVIKRKTRKKEQTEVEAEDVETVTVEKHTLYLLKIKEIKKQNYVEMFIFIEGKLDRKERYDNKTKENALIDVIVSIADKHPGERLTFKIEGFMSFVTKWNDLIASMHEKNERVYIYDVMKNAIAAVEYRALSKYIKRISIIR